MYLTNQKIRKYIIFSLVCFYVTGCHGLNKSNADTDMYTNNNQSEANANQINKQDCPLSDRLTFYAAMFSAKEVFDTYFNSVNPNDPAYKRAKLTRYCAYAKPEANLLTLACMTSYPPINQDRKNDTIKYLLDLFLSNPSYPNNKGKNMVLNILHIFSGTIEYLANRDSLSFSQLFDFIPLPKDMNIEILDREAALAYLISVLEDYNVEATRYRGHWKSHYYTRELFAALQSAVKYKKQRLFKALIQLDVTKNIQNDEMCMEELLDFAGDDQAMVQTIEDSVSA